MNARRFTLVELLTVIVIIMILIGILMPTIAIVIKTAEKNQTKVRMKNLITAIKQYEAQYGILPAPSPAAGKDDAVFTGADNPRLISLLTARGGDYASSNVRGIQFLEPVDPSSPNNYTDAWGQRFYVAIDANYDGEINAANIDGASNVLHGKSGILYGSVLVWSSGPDESPTATADNVYSWDD